MMGNTNAKSRRGQGLSEYGLVLVLISLVGILSLTTTSNQINSILGSVNGALGTASNPCDMAGCQQGCYQTAESTIQAGGGGMVPPGVIIAYQHCMQTCAQNAMDANCQPSVD